MTDVSVTATGELDLIEVIGDRVVLTVGQVRFTFSLPVGASFGSLLSVSHIEDMDVFRNDILSSLPGAAASKVTNGQGAAPRSNETLYMSQACGLSEPAQAVIGEGDDENDLAVGVSRIRVESNEESFDSSFDDCPEASQDFW